MNAWSYVRSIPSSRLIIRNSQSVRGLVSYRLERDGYWAMFTPSQDGTAIAISSYGGNYENECHGGFYQLADAREYYAKLIKAQFVKTESTS